MKKKKKKKETASVQCFYCGNVIESSAPKPINKADFLSKDGAFICAKCLWKDTREMFMSVPYYKEHIEHNRVETIKLAKSKTKEGQSCPSDCRFRNSNVYTLKEGCSAVSSVYTNGECPFYKSRGLQE